MELEDSWDPSYGYSSEARISHRRGSTRNTDFRVKNYFGTLEVWPLFTTFELNSNAAFIY